jgi:cytochrome c oxidase subunit 2
VIPLGLSLVMFAWGASIFFTESKPPADAMEVFVTGKQWMWKIQHNEGAREINELHIPINRDIRLTMTSEDVIHDFYVPAFRTKADVLPGRYTTEWFRPTQLGEYHIFCAEYCGTKHSGMIGTVYVMSEPDYNKWLASGSGEGSMAEQGQALFNQLGCGNCHGSSINKNLGRCPNLVGIFGTTVDLKDGSRTRVDESYIRESILYPQAKIVAGYDDIMPTFKGLLTEDGLLKVVEYIRSLGPKNGAPASVPPSPTETTATESTTQPMGNAPQAGPGTQPRTGAKTGNR